MNEQVNLFQIEGQGRIAWDCFKSKDSKTPNKERYTFFCLPGMGDLRQQYRFIGPLLNEKLPATISTLDLKGHGDSDASNWTEFTPKAVAQDLVSFVKNVATNEERQGKLFWLETHLLLLR